MIRNFELFSSTKENNFQVGDLVRWKGWPWSLGLIVEIIGPETPFGLRYRIFRLFNGYGESTPLERDVEWWGLGSLQKLGVDD